MEKPTNLERIINHVDIVVEKHPEPILSPRDYDWTTSIKNPAAFIYHGKFGLLCTVRHSEDKISRLHLAWSDDGIKFNLEKNPFIDTNLDSSLGVEDARVTKTKDKEYMITFTAFKETDGACNTTRIGLTKTKDFKESYDRTILVDNRANNKNGLVFQGDNYDWMIDRPFDNGNGNCSEPLYAQISNTQNFPEFTEFEPFLKPREGMWDDARVGINTPPIKMKHKELGHVLFMMYHGASKNDNTYSMGYILTDTKNPKKILERSESPLLSPEMPWEKGATEYGAEVPNVVFGCGAVPIGKNKIRVFYAGADMHTSFADLIFNNAEIENYPVD